MDPQPDRWAVRLSGPDGRLTDVTGTIVASSPQTITVRPDDAPDRIIDRTDVVASRRIPARPVRPTSSPEKLQRLAGEGWPGLENARLGGWWLRAADGYSHRANSCLAAGDPGMPPAEAVARVTEFYLARDLTPTLQVPDTSGRPGYLGRDWRVVLPTVFMVADLRRLDLVASAALAVSDTADDAWWSLRSDDSPVARRVMAACPAWYGVLRDGETSLAAGRLSRVRDWVGLNSVITAPDHRGRGLGRAVVTGLLAHAREQGARFAYLQVEQANEPALALYRSMGFTAHHRYAYWEKRP